MKALSRTMHARLLSLVDVTFNETEYGFTTFTTLCFFTHSNLFLVLVLSLRAVEELMSRDHIRKVVANLAEALVGASSKPQTWNRLALQNTMKFDYSARTVQTFYKYKQAPEVAKH